MTESNQARVQRKFSRLLAYGILCAFCGAIGASMPDNEAGKAGLFAIGSIVGLGALIMSGWRPCGVNRKGESNA